MIWTVKYKPFPGNISLIVGYEMEDWPDHFSDTDIRAVFHSSHANCVIAWLKEGDHMPYAHQGPVYEPPCTCKNRRMR